MCGHSQQYIPMISTHIKAQLTESHYGAAHQAFRYCHHANPTYPFKVPVCHDQYSTNKRSVVIERMKNWGSDMKRSITWEVVAESQVQGKEIDIVHCHVCAASTPRQQEPNIDKSAAVESAKERKSNTHSAGHSLLSATERKQMQQTGEKVQHTGSRSLERVREQKET